MTAAVKLASSETAIGKTALDQSHPKASGRRTFLNVLSLGMTAGAVVHLLGPGLATARESSATAKLVFVLYRRSDLTHDESMAEWSGNQHVGIVKKVPGVTMWVQNHLVTPPNPKSPDGIGELWFDNAESMVKAMNSPQMAAASEDAKRFLDMEKTFALTVSEKKFLG